MSSNGSCEKCWKLYRGSIFSPRRAFSVFGLCSIFHFSEEHDRCRQQSTATTFPQGQCASRLHPRATNVDEVLFAFAGLRHFERTSSIQIKLAQSRPRGDSTCSGTRSVRQPRSNREEPCSAISASPHPDSTGRSLHCRSRR